MNIKSMIYDEEDNAESTPYVDPQIKAHQIVI